MSSTSDLLRVFPKENWRSPIVVCVIKTWLHIDLKLGGFFCLHVFKSALKTVICNLLRYCNAKRNVTEFYVFAFEYLREGHGVSRGGWKAFSSLSWVSCEILGSFGLGMIFFKSKGFFSTWALGFCSEICVQTLFLVSSLHSCLIFSISVSSVAYSTLIV